MKINRKRVSIFLVLVIILIMGLFLPVYQVLAFEYENTNNMLAFIPVKEGTPFEIKYIHSIHLTPVYESYFIEQGQIIQDQVSFEKYGIGMPANAEEGESFSEQDGKYVISGMSRAFEQVDLRVALVTESQQMIINEKNIAFETIAKPGTWLRIKVKNINLWQLLKGGNILD